MTQQNIKNHMQACLHMHKGTSFYNSHKNDKGEIVLFRMELDAGGYTKGGRYFGIGAPLFSVQVRTNNDNFRVFEIRGSNESGIKSRNALRAELQKLYQNMKVRR